MGKPQDAKARLLSGLACLRMAQGYALNAAAISIELATAETPEEGREVARQFRNFRDLYGKTLREIEGQSALFASQPKAERLLPIAARIAQRLAEISAEDAGRVTPAEAGALVHFVRLEGVPALMELSGLLGAQKKDHEQAERAQMEERIGQLDKMFTEVEDIGRMIHLISLNASVEAARAGGESGRSFKVIADEIRGLAQLASALIDTTRAGVLPERRA